jgi:hypothetical protein
MEDASGHSEMTGAVQVALAYTEDVFDQLVADAIARGEIAEGIPPQAIRDMISGLMRGLSNIAALEQPIDRYTAAIDAVGELFAGRLFTAIGGKAPRPARRAARSTRAAATKRTAS